MYQNTFCVPSCIISFENSYVYYTFSKVRLPFFFSLGPVLGNVVSKTARANLWQSHRSAEYVSILIKLRGL